MGATARIGRPLRRRDSSPSDGDLCHPASQRRERRDSFHHGIDRGGRVGEKHEEKRCVVDMHRRRQEHAEDRGITVQPESPCTRIWGTKDLFGRVLTFKG